MKDNTISQGEMCGGKRCYSKVEAKTALNSLSHSHHVSSATTGRRRRKIKHRPCRIYECSYCGFWHLTAREDEF